MSVFPEVLPAPEWHENASCSGHPDPELWWYAFHKHSDENQLQVLRLAEAITICNGCPVKAECLQQGLEPENLEHKGVWGGMMMSERVLLKYPKRTRILNYDGRMRNQVRRKLAEQK